jgi:hypothetical protein
MEVKSMKRTFLFLVFALTSGLVANAQEPVFVTRQGPPLPEPVITADQVSGVYRDGSTELRLLALDPNKLKIEFPIDWAIAGPYATNARDLPNPEDAVGEATIEGNVARYVTGDTKKCKITLTFLTNRLEVTKEGSTADCGFRHHVVVATGTYRRIKGGHVRIVRLRS